MCIDYMRYFGKYEVIFKWRGSPIVDGGRIACRSENDVLMAAVILEVEATIERSKGDRGRTLDNGGVSNFLFQSAF